jgi:hypothetical protein
MRFQLLPLNPKHLMQIKKDMQEAFQQGAVDEFSDIDIEILPESDLECN